MGWTEATGRINKPIRGVAWNHVLQKKDGSKAFSNEAQADAWWRQREAELDTIYTDAGVEKDRQIRGVPTLATYGAAFLRTMPYEDTTLKQNLSTLNTEIAAYFGEQVSVAQVSKADIRAMLAKAKERGCGPSGRRNKLAVLRTVLQGAIDDGYRSDDPTRGIPAPQVPKKKARILTLDEIDTLRWAMPDWLGISVLLLSYAGLRIGECCGLRIHSVNEVHSEIMVQHVINKGGEIRSYPKGKMPQPVPMSPDLKRELLTHIEWYSSRQHGFVLWNHDFQVPVRPESLRKYFYQSWERSGLEGPRPTPHDLRHFTATHLAREGAAAYDIQAILRHRNLSTSQRYIDAVPDASKVALMASFRTKQREV